MTVRSRRSLILPNAIRRSMAYLRSNGVQVIPGASTASGGYYRAPVLDALTYDPNTYEMLGVKSGIGGLTIARGSERYVLDNEGVYRRVPANEAAWNGGRRVWNGLRYSQDFENESYVLSDSTITSGIDDPEGGVLAYTLSATGSQGRMLQSNPSVNPIIGNNYLSSIYIRRRTGIGSVEILRSDTSGWDVVTSAITETWRRITISNIASSGVSSGIGVRLGNSGDEVDIAFAQVEDSTGRADLTTPSEYCPTDTAAGPELYTELNAAEGGENSLTGIDQNGLDAGANVFESQNTVTPSTSYAVHVDSNDTPIAAAGMSIDLGTVLGLEDGDFVLLTVKARHSGTGNQWRIYLANAAPYGTSHVVTNSEGVSDIYPADIVFEEFSISYFYDSTYRYLIAREYNSSNDGGIYLSDLSVTKATTGYKVFANANGNTVASNVVTEAVGDPLVELPWYSAAPAASNALVYSRDMTNSAWVKNNAISTYDQVGLTGAPNTASVLGDDSGGGSGGVLIDENAVVVVSGQQNCFVVYAKKKQLSWIRLGTRNFDEPSYETYFDLDNVVIGATDTFPSSAIMTTNDGWIKCIVQFSSTTDVSGTLRINIADGDNDASVDRDGTSDVYIGNVEFYLNKTIAEVRGLPPIFTEGTEVSVQGDRPTLDIANHNNARGAYYFEWRPSYANQAHAANQGLLATRDAPASLLYDSTTDGQVSSGDGSKVAVKVASWAAGQSLKCGVIYDAVEAKMRVCVEGEWGVENDYDGAYVLGTVLNLFYDQFYSNGMRNLQRYDLPYDAAKAKIDELMA